MTNSEKPRLTEQDRELFMRALTEYRKAGSTAVVCNVCGTAIRFVEVGSATRHECECGKFNGTLRGL
jgi:hypothetical protein